MRRLKQLRNEVEEDDSSSHETRSSHKNMGSLDASYAKKFYLSVKDNETDLKFPQNHLRLDGNEMKSQMPVVKQRELVAVPEVDDNESQNQRNIEGQRNQK